MMSSKIAKSTPIDSPTALPVWTRNRKAWIIGGLTLAGIGLALKWDWLTAVGAAPVLLGVLPCVAMCALGLCMRGGSGQSCQNQNTGTEPDSEIQTGRNGG
jgi:hypothetical protein